MSFPRYEKYKDSGIEWLSEVPSHWNTKRLRFALQLNPSRGEVSDVDRDTEVQFLPMEAVGEDGTLVLERTRPLREVDTGYTYFRNGDVTIAKITPCFENGKGAVMWDLFGGFGFGTTELIVARPLFKETSADYLHLLFTSSPFRKLGEAAMYGAGGQKRVPDDFVRNFAISFPPLPEQRTIAAFLDHETGKIDALVAEQEKLIGLLKEKRQAVISHAVTKGLDPNARMKDSGLEWLGEVPEGWEVKCIRYFAEVLRGKFTHRPRNDPDFYDGEYPFIQTGDITGTSKFITGYKQTLNERGIAVSKEFPKGTLVMAIAANIGDVAILNFPAYFPDSIVGLVPKKDVDLNFLYFLMIAMKQPMLRNATISTQMNLNTDQICSLIAACPSRSEQKEIIGFLNNETAKIDALIEEAKKAIELMKERRTALISAAVTGKIDVRGYLSSETQRSGTNG